MRSDVRLADQLVVARAVVGMAERRELAALGLQPVREQLLGGVDVDDDSEVGPPRSAVAGPPVVRSASSKKPAGPA